MRDLHQTKATAIHIGQGFGNLGHHFEGQNSGAGPEVVNATLGPHVQTGLQTVFQPIGAAIGVISRCHAGGLCYA